MSILGYVITDILSRYGNNGCRRTYLSGRDLQAHIAHRHSDKKAGDRDKGRDKEKEDSLARSVSSISKASLASVLAAVNSAASTYNSYTAAGGQLSTAVTAVTAGSSGRECHLVQSAIWLQMGADGGFYRLLEK